MMRIVQHPVGQPLLDDAAAFHDDHALRQEARNGEVVRHDDDRQAEIGDQRPQEVEHARLLSQCMIVMKSGRIVEQGLTDRVLDDPHHPYTQLLVASIPES